MTPDHSKSIYFIRFSVISQFHLCGKSTEYQTLHDVHSFKELGSYVHPFKELGDRAYVHPFNARSGGTTCIHLTPGAGALRASI